MRIWCFPCFTGEDEEDENGCKLKKQSLATAMENNNGHGDFGENEMESGVPEGTIFTENPRWGSYVGIDEEGEDAGAELQQLWTSEARLHQLVQGESSNAAAAEDSTMEEADHDSHHKRAKVYSGPAECRSVSGVSSDAGNSGSSVSVSFGIASSSRSDTDMFCQNYILNYSRRCLIVHSCNFLI